MTNHHRHANSDEPPNHRKMGDVADETAKMILGSNPKMYPKPSWHGYKVGGSQK